MILQERQFQRYTRQEAELVDNPKGKGSFLKGSVLALILFICKLLVSKNLQLDVILPSFKRQVLEKLRAAEQIPLLT